MKKILLSFICVLVFAGAAFAHPYQSVNYFMLRGITPSDSDAKNLLNEFATDVGQAISGASYGVGGNLDTFGFNLSLKVSYQQLLTNSIIANHLGDSAISYPIVQGEFALTDNLIGIGRLSYANDSYVFGAGGRYLIYQGYGYIPTISLQSVFNYMVADVEVNDYRVYVPWQPTVQFTAWDWKTSPMFYFQDVPYVQPYLFVSFDVAGVNLLSSDRTGMGTIVTGFGYGVGAQAKINPLTFSFTLSVLESRLNYNFAVSYGF